MESQDVFYYSLSLGFLILSLAAGYALFQMGQTFKTFQQVVAEIQETAHDINAFKNSLKSSAARMLMSVLGKISKGGDN